MRPAAPPSLLAPLLVFALIFVGSFSVRPAAAQPEPAISIVNSRTPPRLTLSSASCENLLPQLQALSALKANIDHEKPGQQPKLPECLCDPSPAATEKRCHVVADSVLPEEMLRETDLTPACNGPNCWNSSLRMAQVLTNPRYTNSREMSAWLNSPLCSELSSELGSGSKPSPGDIVAIRDRFGQELHAFTYITGSLAYSKNGLSKAVPYEFSSPEEVLKEYGVTAKCRAPRQDGCATSNHVQYFRCTSFEAYKASLPEKNTELSRSMETADSVECAVSQYSLFGRSASAPLNQEVLGSLREATYATRASLTAIPADGTDSLLKKLSLLKLESLLVQLKIMNSR